MEAAVTSRRGTQRGVRFVSLERQHAPIKHDLHEVLARLLCSSAYTLGSELEHFEAAFAAYCEVEHCIGVSSGTAALRLMLEAYGIGPGDEVIVPAHTYIASALAVVHAGATPVLCDVEDGTGLIDADAARAAIGPRTAAIIAVHLYGQICNMAAVQDVAKTHGLLVLEDAAQAHGARYCGHRAGSFGEAAAFSFYPSKNLGALGDGGAVCTDDDLLAVRLRRLRNLGQRAKGEHLELGYNERLDGLQAAVLRVKLAHLDAWNEARCRLAEQYRTLLPPDVRVVREQAASASVHHVFAVRVGNRDQVAAELLARGIETGVHYSPAVHGHPVWRGRPIVHQELPVAEAWADEELSLPMHPYLLPGEVAQVVDALYDVSPEPVRISEPVLC